MNFIPRKSQTAMMIAGALNHQVWVNAIMMSRGSVCMEVTQVNGWKNILGFCSRSFVMRRSCNADTPVRAHLVPERQTGPSAAHCSYGAVNSRRLHIGHRHAV